MRNSIIINADDLGYSSAVNTAITELAENQALQATSYMAFGEISPEHRARLLTLRDRDDFKIGLHTDFTSHLIPEGVIKKPLKTLILHSVVRQLNITQIQTSIQTQFERFEQTWGFLPDFIDGHEHVHQFAQIRQVLLNECKKHYSPDCLPLIRSTKPFSGTRTLKAHIIYLLGGRSMRRLAHAQDFPMNEGFGGVYNFQADESKLVQLWNTWLNQAKKEGGIIMCHPALTTFETVNDPIAQARLREFNYLQSRP